MHQLLLVFRLVSAVAIVFEAIDFPRGAMIGPFVAVAWLANFTGIKPKPGFNADHFTMASQLGTQVPGGFQVMRVVRSRF